MADRLLALFGTGKGPSIPVKGEARLKVQGLLEAPSERVLVTADNEALGDVTKDGEYPLPEGTQMVQCDYQGTNRQLSCLILVS